MKQLAEEFLDSVSFPDTLQLELGEIQTDRCFAVNNAELLRIQAELHRHLLPLHIGESDSVVERNVNTRRWNY